MNARKEIEELLGQIGLGQRAAFDQLYILTSAKLFSICLRVLHNRAEAEDALQEVFVKIWHNAARYRVNGLSPMTWLITVARNHAIDRLRARKATVGALDMVQNLPDPAPGPEAQAIASDESARIAACLDELPDDRADAVRRAYLGGETYAELADHFAVPLNTMRTWLRRALMTLKECLTR